MAYSLSPPQPPVSAPAGSGSLSLAGEWALQGESFLCQGIEDVFERTRARAARGQQGRRAQGVAWAPGMRWRGRSCCHQPSKPSGPRAVFAGRAGPPAQARRPRGRPQHSKGQIPHSQRRGGSRAGKGPDGCRRGWDLPCPLAPQHQVPRGPAVMLRCAQTMGSAVQDTFPQGPGAQHPGRVRTNTPAGCLG